MTGRIGVAIFFLITGYLAIPSRRNRTVPQYFLNRFLRMYPIYWLLLLITYICAGGNISLRAFLFNLSIFQEFFRVKSIIGSSWMMPIQIAFFVFIAFSGIKFFFRTHFRSAVCLISVLIGALVTGYVRYKTGFPFPTAFFLLTAAALIGMYYFDYTTEKHIHKKQFIVLLIMFEVCLIVSAQLSYSGKMPAYFVAYNIGMLLFFIVKRNNIVIYPFVRLGKIGFAFFLGADITLHVLSQHIDVAEIESTFSGVLLVLVLHFILTVIFASFITEFMEKPLLSYGHKLEKKL